MFLADTLSRATIIGSRIDQKTEAGDVMCIQETRSMTEQEIEEIDMLRNLPVKDSTLNQIRQETTADITLRALMTVIKEGWPNKRSDVLPVLYPYRHFRDELVQQKGVVFKGERLIISSSTRTQMVDRLHCNHGGIQATSRRARDVFYWPGMNQEIETFVASCRTCSAYQSGNQKEPLMGHPIPARPWQYIATDLLYLKGQGYLVTVDYYSKFIEIDRLYDTTNSEVIHKLKAHMTRHGIPKRVVSDNGHQYSSDEFRRFAMTYEFEHVTSSVLTEIYTIEW